MRKRSAVIVSLITTGVFLIVAKSYGITWQSQPLIITQVMTVEEFRASGLSKLTPEELGQLDGWLNRYTLRIATAVLEKSSEKNKAPAESEVIENRIEGEFEGWTGDTVFKLENGQIWQQVSFGYRYRYAFRPKILIYKSGSTYKMKVDGMNDEIVVKRLK